MVLFLRPTESSTVFIQQLGRGLRKFSGKDYVTVLDFIGNSYKRSVQIAFALSSLAENFVLEKRLMISLVNDNFIALGLSQYGVEINIDDLSKEEIINYIENENFNSLNYLKQDYFNFKKYIGAEHFPKHMDYLNNDCAPDLLRFMSIKIGGRKTSSYYSFLHGIDEEYLPIFTDTQMKFINYLSDMLPLVRQHEYLIYHCLLSGPHRFSDIENLLSDNIKHYHREALGHALKYMEASSFITTDQNAVTHTVPFDDQFREYVQDLLKYGLTRYVVDFGDIDEFKLWASYRMDQVQLKLCKNPGYNMKGTYVYDGVVYIFASIKKDASVKEHLNYSDKFLQADLFQWECEAGLTPQKQQELIDSEKAHLFIRKVESENGLVLPFTYVGVGKLTNPRPTKNINGSLLFDITMDAQLPDYLQYDFGLSKEIN